ncbi:MAG: hypothetical protein K6E29_02130 [Cyanobacteria bacterium RUI128]|nr:hypothetical protein [Cyanobacteria bacterium RUI128]
MNTISFTPNYGTINRQNTNNKPNQAYYSPSFQGAEKLATKAKAKPVSTVVNKLYGLFFGGAGSVKMIKDGSVYTECVVKGKKGKSVISNKFPLWSNTPEMTVVDNLSTKSRKKITYNPDKTKNIEIRDMHNPEYKISAEYKGVADTCEYDGPVLLNYCGKTADISSAERKKLIEELDKDIEKIEESSPNLFRLPREDFKKFYDSYFQNPSVIGRAILTSPSKLEKQIEIVPASMPYGIEAIFEKMGK